MNDKIKELRADLEACIEAAQDIQDAVDKDSRDFTLQEQEKFDGLMEKRESLVGEIGRREKLAAAKAAQVEPEVRKVTPAKPDTRTTSNRIEVPRASRYGGLRAFKGADALRDAYISGMYLLGALFPDSEQGKRARQWCREHGVEIRAQSEGVNTAGGFLVPAPMLATIIDLREEYGVFRREANVVPMERDTLSVPRRTGGLTAYFVAENQAATESDASWGQVNLTARKVATLTRMSTEISEDAVINMADRLAAEIAYAFAYKEDLCGFLGDQSTTYGGIQGVAQYFARTGVVDTFKGAVNAASGHDLLSEVDKDDLAACIGVLPTYARPNAKWYCSQMAYSLVFESLLMAQGGSGTNDLANGAPPRYMGFPIVISQVLASTTSACNNTHLLLFGDLRQACTMGVSRDVTIATTNDRYFEYDQVGIRGTERFDINFHEYGDASNAGAMVALIGNT